MEQEKIIKQFTRLNITQKRELYKQLETILYANERYVTIRQDIVGNDVKCSHCHSEHVIKFGTFQGRMRFRCKSCSVTFTELTGTSISGIKKKYCWEHFIKLLTDGKSIRYIAKHLHLSTKTVFDWRHKVLTSLQPIFTKQFKGIVETDDIFFNLNQKGRRTNKVCFNRRKRGVSNQKVAVMITADRYKTLDMKVAKLGRVSKNYSNVSTKYLQNYLSLFQVLDFIKSDEDGFLRYSLVDNTAVTRFKGSEKNYQAFLKK